MFISAVVLESLEIVVPTLTAATSSRIRSLTPTYFGGIYLVLTRLCVAHRKEQATTPVLKALSVDAQEVSKGWLVLSNGWVMNGWRNEQFSLL